MCWYCFLVCMNIMKLCVNLPLMNRMPDAIGCSENGEGWCFKTCWLNIPIFVTHILTTMQTCAVVRMVFIKTSKNKYTCAIMKEDAAHLWGDIYETFWESDNAHHHYMHPSEVRGIDDELKKRWPERYAIDYKKKQDDLLKTMKEGVDHYPSMGLSQNKIVP